VVIAVVVRQPSAFCAQVARMLFGRQTVPGPPQSDGAGGQVQAAFGAVPAHGRPAVQFVIDFTARQPLASRSQLTSMFPWQEAPAPPAQAAGGAGHEQVADGCLPVHGLPDGQVMRVAAMVTQPSASLVQVAIEVVDSQKVPAPFAQAAGGAGHWHSLAAQICGAEQAVSPPQAAHPSTMPQVWTPPPGPHLFAPSVHAGTQVGPEPPCPPSPLPAVPALPP
jgi:hypothetical protein